MVIFAPLLMGMGRVSPNKLSRMLYRNAVVAVIRWLGVARLSSLELHTEVVYETDRRHLFCGRDTLCFAFLLLGPVNTNATGVIERVLTGPGLAVHMISRSVNKKLV